MAAIYSGTNTTFQNSIVSNDGSGGNCDTIDNGITSNGFNLSSDTTCAFNKVGDVVVEMKTKTEPSADPKRNSDCLRRTEVVDPARLPHRAQT